ncbi:MAG: hypothetical protein EOP73_29790, partial [Variovorax sp.]
MDTLLATLDQKGRVLEWSRGGELLTGHAPDAALGRALNELLPGFDGCAAWMRSAHLDGSCELRVQAPGPDGRKRRFEGTLYALGVTTSSPRFGLILRDVSDRAAQGRLIEARRDELAQLNRHLLDQEKRTSRRLASMSRPWAARSLTTRRMRPKRGELVVTP